MIITKKVTIVEIPDLTEISSCNKEIKVKFVEDEGKKVYTGLCDSNMIKSRTAYPVPYPKFMDNANITFSLTPSSTQEDLVSLRILDIIVIK